MMKLSTRSLPSMFCLALFGLLIISPQTKANPKPSTERILHGKVTDANTNLPIIGATVIITGTTTGTATDNDGGFFITNPPKDLFTVTVSYISYKSVVSQPIKIASGESFDLNIKMVEQSSELENIVVVTSRPIGTDAALVNQMRNMNAVASGISAQAIARSQDRDAAEVVRRIAGISIIDSKFVIVRGLAQRYNNVWINGAAVPSSEADTRSFSFDQIPSSQLESMTVVKSPTAQLPGDFAGGFVEIATRSIAPENSTEISYGSGFNSATHSSRFYFNPGSGTDLIGFDNGARSLKTAAASRIDNSDTKAVDRASKEGFAYNWNIRQSRAIPDQRLSMVLNRRFVSDKGTTIGATAAINYSFTQKSLTGMENSRFGIYDNVSDQKVYLYKYNDDQYSTNVRLGAMLNLLLRPQSNGKSTHTYRFNQLFNQLGQNKYTLREGYHVASGYYEQLQQEYNYASRTSYTGQFCGEHTWGNNGLKWNAAYSYSNRNQPDRRIVERQKDQSNGITEYQIDQSFVSRDFITLGEHLVSASADYSRTLGSKESFSMNIKAGMHGEYKKRDYDTRAFVYKWNDTSLLPNGFAALPTEQIFTPQNMGTEKIHIQDNSNNTDNYKADNRTVAAYAAVEIPLGQLNIYAGVRAESFLTQLTSYLSETDLRTRRRDYKYFDLLPSANISYNLTKRALIRAAYGKSLNRQEFRELSPASYYDFDMFSTVIGNTALKQAEIQNFDLKYEFYPSSGEMISAAVFYKHFKNPIEWTYTDAGGSYIFSFQNANNAISYGAEIELRKSLDFLSMPRFTLSLNAAWIESEVRFEKGSLEHNRPMQGQSPYLINGGIHYANDKSGTQISVLYNRIGRRIVGIGRVQASDGASINNNIPDMYELPRNNVDLSITQRIYRNLQIKLSAVDLLSEKVEFKQYPRFIDATGTEHKREQVTKTYNPGRSFQFTLSAKF